LAEIYVVTGKYDDAARQLKELLSHPGFTSLNYIKADPIWAPLISSANFKQIER
jgi:hypothetical protein